MAKKFELKVTSGQEILSRMYPNGALGGLALDGQAPAELGNKVQLTVRFSEPVRDFDVLTLVAWIRHKGSPLLRGDFGLEFIEADRNGRDRLLRFAQSELPLEATRFDQRVATNLPVKITIRGVARKEQLCDLSHGGAFVRSALPAPIGTEVTLSLRPPLALRSISIQGRVVWVRRSGDVKGMGIAFAYKSAKEDERLDKLIARINSRSR